MHRKLGAWLVCFHSTLSPSFFGYAAYTSRSLHLSISRLALVPRSSLFIPVTVIRFSLASGAKRRKGVARVTTTPQNASRAIPRVSYVMDETGLSVFPAYFSSFFCLFRIRSGFFWPCPASSPFALTELSSRLTPLHWLQVEIPKVSQRNR